MDDKKQLTTKKIICDDVLITYAKRASKLAREGNLSSTQLQSLIDIDTETIKKYEEVFGL